MTALRFSSTVAAARRACLGASTRPAVRLAAPWMKMKTPTPTQTQQTRLASQGYGDGKGNPQAEDPQSAPASSKAQESGEHPGPPPPDVGKGTGGGPTKSAISESIRKQEQASAESGGSRSKEAAETGSSPTGGVVPDALAEGNATGKTGGGKKLDASSENAVPQPKISNMSVPGVDKEGSMTKEQKEEVEEHNRDFDKKYDRTNEAAQDKVDKSFWSGEEKQRN